MSLEVAYTNWERLCKCGKELKVPRSCECAHFVSEALIKVGFDLRTAKQDGDSCEEGRPLFTKDLRRWFQENGKQVEDPPEGYCFSYQEKGSGGQGERHVVLLKTENGRTKPPEGAIDHVDWTTKEYYVI